VRSFHVSNDVGAGYRRKQLRTLRSVDIGLTRLMTTLSKLGELDNTYVIYTSDSGFLWGEHGLAEKHFPYAGADHIPFFFRGPGIPAGMIDGRLTVNADVAPTLYGLAGITPSYTVDGRPFLGPPAHSQILIEYSRAAEPPFPPSWASLVSLTSWFSQYTSGRRAVFEEYYDLSVDPYQLSNTLQGGKPPPPGLRDALVAAKSCSGATCP
jgi:arylsulfatase A-like enzyme